MSVSRITDTNKDGEDVLAAGAIGARVAGQPSDDAAELVGAPDASLRILAGPLVDEAGLLIDKCASQSMI